MQIPADPLDAAALDAALQVGQEQYPRILLQADWNRDGGYSHAYSDLSVAGPKITLNAELSDATPGSDTIASGAAAAELTVDLTGSMLVGAEYIPVSEIFAPYNTASPLYGIPVIDTPIAWSVRTWTNRGWISLTQFTGWIDERTTVLDGNRVTLKALNTPPKLRDPTFWPPWAVDGPAAARANTYDPQRGLASSVVDYICNQAGLRTRPRPPWESSPSTAIALCWLPLCGSFAPAAGKQISQHPWGNFQLFPATYPISPGLNPDGIYWVDGPFGTARWGQVGVYAGSLIYTTRDQQPTWAGYASSVTAWVYCGPDVSGYEDNPGGTLRPQLAAVYYGYTTGAGNYYAIRLSIASSGTTLQIQVEDGSGRHYYATYTPGTDAWRHVHAQLDTSTSPPTAKLFVDGTQQASFSVTGTSNSIVATALNVLFLPQVGFHLRPGTSMCDAMAWQEAGAPTITPERTVYGGVAAVIDRSYTQITHLPSPGDAGWDVIKAIAAVEYAALTVSEVGVLYFRNRDNVRWSQDQTVVTLSIPTSVGLVDSEDGRANTALISARPGEASWQRAWDLPSVDSIIAVPGVTEWIFPLDSDVIAIESGTVPPLMQSATSASTLPVWSGSASTGYVFVYDGTETEELTNQNMVNLTDQSGLGDQQLFRIVVTNTNTSTGRFRLKDDTTAGTDPQPALRIAGLILAQPAVETDTVSWAENVAADGQVRTLNLSGGDWRQHLDSVRSSALFALRRATQQIANFNQFQVPGDPRRQLSDQYLLRLGGMGPRIYGFLAGIDRSFDEQGFRDTLTIKTTHAPGRWALDDPVLGVLESTAILG